MKTKPLVKEITYRNPVDIFALFYQQPGAILFDSASAMMADKTENNNDCNISRYSFIAIDPFQTLTCKNGTLTIAVHNTVHNTVHKRAAASDGSGSETTTGNPFETLKKALQEYQLEKLPDPVLPPFQGGVAGFFGYDLCHHLEKLSRNDNDILQIPDLVLGFYDVVLACDNLTQKMWVFSSGLPEQDFEKRQSYAELRLEQMLQKISPLPRVEEATVLNLSRITTQDAVKSSHTADDYHTMVQRAIAYINAGDIFQANVSQCFQAKLKPNVSALALYQKLRIRNPSPFMAFINFVGGTILSASPERFLKLTDNHVEARPIKGTRRRELDPSLDIIVQEELKSSIKDRAENIMIVDLLRNDLSRVCEDFSVEVSQLCGIESFPSVHHLVSVINGIIKPQYDAIDLISATFPCGSVTGAPKIRAMDIIAELEALQRGPYCGCIGYIGFNGDMDLSITIRTFILKGQDIYFQTGGGIVADSDPIAEYHESLDKAYALKQTLVE